MRAVLDARAAGVPVIVLIGGTCGAFGGMGIVSRLCSAIVMSEEGRLALSGPEVIETVAGVEEFDSKDRALVWRVTGGKHRYLTGDCNDLVDDDIDEFREGLLGVLSTFKEAGPSLEALKAEQRRLTSRKQKFEGMRDGLEVWSALGIDQAEAIPLMDRERFIEVSKGVRA